MSITDKIKALEATLRTCCENEEAARAIAAKVLGDKAQGNSYCVPSVQDLMELVVGRVGELEQERDNYKFSYDRAIGFVDQAFQVDSRKPPPLLPDFLRLGDCKFEGVVKLAEAYNAAEARLAAIGERAYQTLKKLPIAKAPDERGALFDIHAIATGETNAKG